ncbi:MAG: REP-associated tyrosine transposase [Arenimonas sp.]
MTIAKHYRGHQALRKGRVSIPNQIYLITVCCRNREKTFLDHIAAHALSSTLHSVLQKQNSTILAWVVMPDHMHLALQLAEDEALEKIMNRLNSCTAIAVNRAINRHSPVWQGAYHDHALRDEDQLSSAIRYLISNPIRAGLVHKLGDYPYWNITIAEPGENLLY